MTASLSDAVATTAPCPRIQRTGVAPQRGREVAALFHRAHQHVRFVESVGDVPEWNPGSDDGRHMDERFERATGDAKRQQRIRMIVARRR